MTVRSVVLSVSAAITLVAATASAAEAHRRSGVGFKLACGQDVENFCKDAAPGKAVFACLKSHKSELSEKCQSFLDRHHRSEGGEPQPKE